MGGNLTYFKVENFKKFSTLEVKDIGQFNLITGDNNVGKTCLLEALILNSKIKETLGVLRTILRYRSDNKFRPLEMRKNEPDRNFAENIFSKFLNNPAKPFKIEWEIGEEKYNCLVENIKGRLATQKSEVVDFSKEVIGEFPDIDDLSENWLFSYIDGKINFIVDITSKFYRNFVATAWSLPYVSMRDQYDVQLLAEYKKLDPNGEKSIAAMLNQVFDNVKITGIRLAGYDIQIVTSARPSWHNIYDYGDGVLRVLKFILTLISLNDKRIMIDEIDAGVHHSKHKSLFKLIFNLCGELGIQVFATTHSKECAEAFVEAAKDAGNENEIRMIELFEVNNSISAFTTKGIDNIGYQVKKGTFRGEPV